MMKGDPEPFNDAFYKHLTFGTAGLRGKMGVGTNRMNEFTVAIATQGFANYLKSKYPHDPPGIVVGYDVRHRSDEFARITSRLLAANGIKVFLFQQPRPTPLLSFAIRHLGCQGGVVITASHNPKQYNGYKVFNEFGGQVVEPDDGQIIEQVEKVGGMEGVKQGEREDLCETLGEDLDRVYFEKVLREFEPYMEFAKPSKVRLVFSPLHGTGGALAPQLLRLAGFEKIELVESQMEGDGSFPTVSSPNPEDAEAMGHALRLAKSSSADLVLVTDPDADRVGVAVAGSDQQFHRLSGNQVGILLTYFILEVHRQKKDLLPGDRIFKTIVTTEMLTRMAASYGIRCDSVLTGFKYISQSIEGLGKQGDRFLFGAEESNGYLAGSVASDKDAISTCLLLAAFVCWVRGQGAFVDEILVRLAVRFGVFHDQVFSKTMEGRQGSQQIAGLMAHLRKKPREIFGVDGIVKEVWDLKARTRTELDSGKKTSLDLPESDVLQFHLDPDDVVTIRPSGTEPKIKFYYGVSKGITGEEEYQGALEALRRRVAVLNSRLEDLGSQLNSPTDRM